MKTNEEIAISMTMAMGILASIALIGYSAVQLYKMVALNFINFR